jgi:hypothetical protein
MKLKEVKEQPLMRPPQVEGDLWMEVTGADVKLIHEAIEVSRQNSWHFGVRGEYYALKRLGYPKEMTARDRHLIEWGLGMDRTSTTENGVALALDHMMMRELGFTIDVTQDERVIRRELDRCRSEDGSFHLADMHYYMRQIGSAADVTGYDRRLMLYALGRFTDVQDRLRLHAHARALGIETEITDEEKEAFREKLAQARREGSGATVGNMLVNLQMLYPPQNRQKTMPQMPPLKRF